MRHASLWRRVAVSVAPVAREPAVWVFAAVWAVAVLWLAARGHERLAVAGAWNLAVIALLGTLTVVVTEPPPPAPNARRGMIAIQLGLVMVLVVFTLPTSWILHRVIDGPVTIPVWSEVVDGFGRLGKRWLSPEWVGSPYQSFANPAMYFLLPLLIVLPLTGLRHLGLGCGHRVFRVAALWGAVPLMIIAWGMVTGRQPWHAVWTATVMHTLQNGPFEEFLFRGVIQTRLVMLMRPAWGIVLASMIFGLWHFGLGYTHTGRQSLLDATAASLALQTVGGLGYGILYHRTRNLIAPSLVHILFNVAAR